MGRPRECSLPPGIFFRRNLDVRAPLHIPRVGLSCLNASQFEGARRCNKKMLRCAMEFMFQPFKGLLVLVFCNLTFLTHSV